MGDNGKYKVAGIGELLWDLLPTGKELGGAPFNYTYHALKIGCESYIISAVGEDTLGNEITTLLNKSGMDCQFIQVNSYPTGTVSVILDNQGMPDYIIHENVAWDYIHWNDNLKSLASSLDALCFGSLAQRNKETAQTIQSFISALKIECLKVFDINLRQNYYDKEKVLWLLNHTDVLKFNNDELPVIASFVGLKGNIKTQLRQLIKEFKLSLLAYTMGAEGSILLNSEAYSTMKAPKINIVDTVGAGDSFTAILIAGILKNKPLPVIHTMATELSAFICTQKGATPVIPDNILNRINLYE